METKPVQAPLPATPRSKPGSAASPVCNVSPRKKAAWVVADRKHRVPEPPLPGPAPAVGLMNGSQRGRAVKERKNRLHSEYDCIYKTIDSIMNRCRQVQQRLVSSTSSSTAGNSTSGHSPTYITSRSKLLFEAPSKQHIQEAAAQPETVAEHQTLSAGGQHQGQQSLQGTAWAAAVDLNPGFSFQPGTPQRIAATCPDELPMVLARFAGLVDEVKHMDLGQLHHREALQAGIQQLNGEFYAALLAAAVKQHRQEQQQANKPLNVVPKSWQSQ